VSTNTVVLSADTKFQKDAMLAHSARERSHIPLAGVEPLLPAATVGYRHAKMLFSPSSC
jgi:hypothetical protein